MQSIPPALATAYYSNDTQRRNQSTSTLVMGTPIVDSSSQTTATVSIKNKHLQPDIVVLSAEAKALSAEAEGKTEVEGEADKKIDASSIKDVMSPESAAENTGESDLDKEIRELGMKVLELSVNIQLLQDDEDNESVKERRALEVDLAITKGLLEEAIKRKLKQGSST